MFKKSASFLIGLVFLLAACSPAATPDAVMEKTPTEEAMMENSPTPDPASDTMLESPAWYSEVFTDASSGMVFSVDDFKGKVILVETLAMWCSNCRAQQQQVLALHGLLGAREDFVSLGIDIDTNENLDDLKSYVASNGFDWYYAVATPEVARAFSQLYGDQFLNPPSTPMLIIDRQGEAHPLPFGIKSAEELLDYLTPYLDEDM